MLLKRVTKLSVVRGPVGLSTRAEYRAIPKKIIESERQFEDSGQLTDALET
jgi:hypothetical protein